MKKQKSDNYFTSTYAIVLALFILSGAYSQTITTNFSNLSPGGFFDKVFDKDGREYALSQLIINKTANGASGNVNSIISTTCQSGFFIAHFAAGSGMSSTTNTFEIACRNTVCQVLENVSYLLGWNGTWPNNAYVHILVDDIAPYVGARPPSNSNILGIASAYYATPSNPSSSNPGLIRNQLEKTIQSKVDAWTNVSLPLSQNGMGYYHGYMAFNFANPTFQWNPSYSSLAAVNQIDLYTVILHEITHALGFASLINNTGLSKFGAQNNYYSIYDNYLFTSTNNKLLNSTGCSYQYGLSFGPSTSNLQPFCTCPTCYTSDFTNCTIACKYSSGLIPNMPVYTPNCFEPPSSLSHFEDMCYPTNTPATNNLYFTMSNANGAGTNKRFLKQEERNVLCDLGYTVSTTYTSMAAGAATVYAGGQCNPPNIYGVNDGIFAGAYTYTAIANTVQINITGANGVINNDALSTIGVTCVESVYANGTASVSGNAIIFTPANNYTGAFLLRYIPVNSNNIQGNITYIYGYIFPAGCSPVSPCDMVQNKGFESHLNCGAITGTSLVSVSCWDVFTLTPDLLVNNCFFTPSCNLGLSTLSSSPTFSSHNMSTNPNNTAVIGLTGYCVNLNSFSESMLNFLGTPLVPGTAYNISFWAYNYCGNKIDPGIQPTILQSINSSSLPVSISFATRSSPSVPFGTAFPVPGQDQVYTTTLSTQMNTWKYYTGTFTFSPVNNITAGLLYVGPNSAVNSSITSAAGLLSPNPYMVYLLLDDVSIRPAAQTVSIGITSLSICAGNGYTNLAQYVSVPTGTFSGPGVSTVSVNGNIQYNFNTPAVLNNGIYTLTYNYIDNIGCIQTSYVQITLTNLVAPPVLAMSANSVCAVNNITLTAAGSYSSIIWQPGNLTSSVISVPPGSGITYTAYAFHNSGCITHQQVQVPIVDIFPLYTITTATAGFCSGTATSFTLDGSPVFTSFTCNPGGFSTSPFVTTLNSPTQFTITALIAPGCQLTSYFNVTPKLDCCTGINNVVSNIPPNSVVSLSTTNVINFPIFVPSTSTLNVSGELKFAPGAYLQIAGVVNLNTAHLYGCQGTMWEGLKLQRGAVFNSQPPLNSNLIEDAKIAVDLTEMASNGFPAPSSNSGTFQPAVCQISNTIFNKNYVGIHIENFPITTTNNFNFSLKSSVFTCRNLTFTPSSWPQATTGSGGLRFQTNQSTTILSSPYLLNGAPVAFLKAPYSNNRSLAAIEVLRVGTTAAANVVHSLVIGETANAPANFNLFDSHAIGIDASNSHLGSFNNVFQNTEYNSAVGTNAGIRHINTYNLVNPFGANYWLQNAKLDLVAPSNPSNCNNKFYDCNTAVYAAGTSSLTVRYALFSSSQTNAIPYSIGMRGLYGLEIISNKFDNYQIHNNKFLSVYADIDCKVKFDYLSFSPSSTVYGERWGTFSCTANYFSGASAVNAALGSGRTASAIRFQSPITSQTSPVLSFYTTAPLNGIKIMYNNFDRVQCGVWLAELKVTNYTKTVANNSFLLAPTTNTNFSQWGINSTSNKYSIINTNTVIGFSTNQTRNVAGILHQDNLVGASVQCNNVSNLQRGFEHKNKNPNMIWRENKMANCWHGMHATNWGTFAVSSASVGMGIGPQGSVGNKSGNQWLGTSWSLSNPQTWVDGNSYANSSPLWSMSSGNEWLNPSNQDMLPGVLPVYTYQNPSNRPSSNTGISVCPSTGGGCLNCSARAGSDEYDLDSEIANLLLFISIDLDSLNALNNDTLDAWYADLEDQIGDLFKIEGFLSQGDFSTAQSYLNAYTPETNVQENFKSYFQFYRKYAEFDSLSANDSLSLLVLASQCPAVDGPAIHKARSLYDLIYGGLTFYNDDSCETNGYTGARNGKVVDDLAGIQTLITHESRQIKGRLRNHYSLFPNPASTRITISSSNYTGAATVSIFDLSGHILLSKSTSFENNQIMLELDLANGIYFVRINEQANGTTNKKLIINR